MNKTKKEKHAVTKELTDEANKKLKNAIEKKNYTQIETAYRILETAAKSREEEEKIDKESQLLQEKLIKKKRKCNLDDFFIIEKKMKLT